MLTQLYCTIDDFCKLLEQELGKKRLLGSEKSRNYFKISLSEIATIAIYYHYSGYKNFKNYYEKKVKIHLKNEFPTAPSYSRIVELKQNIFWFLALFSQAVTSSCTGISIVDSTSLQVCHPRRIYRHKIFKGIAERGKTSIKWFFGFKLHMTINQFGEIISFFITPGNVSDGNQDVLDKITKDMFGKLLADKGYLGRFKDLYERGITIIHGLRSNMKNQLMSLFDKLLLRQRGIIETVFGILKESFNLEHSRHRSIKGFFINIFTTLIAYAFRPKKPTINLSNFCFMMD
ncbi:IS982 family transposase [Candidatus Babeliales bacterium]|nr:IS982 family transposase [Candidatus Babeliales bacterium]